MFAKCLQITIPASLLFTILTSGYQAEANILKQKQQTNQLLPQFNNREVLSYNPPNKITQKKPKQDYKIEDIEKAAEFASAKTGVRKDFIMGLLVVESDLGRNTGKCTYGEIEEETRVNYNRGRLSPRAWNTFQRRTKIFEEITSGLEYDYREMKVSCNPSNYTGTGGAMGIPQFMPDTWMEYKGRISSITGKENPDPWDTTDGVLAMALKLSDVPGVVNHNLYSEKNAAKLYLSGTTSVKYNWYANKAVYWSINYRYLMT